MKIKVRKQGSHIGIFSQEADDLGASYFLFWTIEVETPTPPSLVTTRMHPTLYVVLKLSPLSLPFFRDLLQLMVQISYFGIVQWACQ